jgi:hypothetical protein
MNGLLRGASYVFAAVAALFVAMAVLSLLDRDMGLTPSGRNALDLDTSARTQALVQLAVGAAAMAFGWRRRFEGWTDAVAVGGAMVWTWVGWTQPSPAAWMVAPAFLLPWLLLVVDVPPRHRVVMLAVQWLASAMLLETLTRSPASTMVITALGAVHLVLAWTTLRDTHLRHVPIAFGAVFAVGAFAVSAYFLATGPTLDRLWATLVPVVALLALWKMADGTLLAKASLPVLVRRTPTQSPAAA